MKTVIKKSTPFKMGEIAQILTQFLNKGYCLPQGNFKRIKGRFPQPILKSRIIRGFEKMAFLSLKGGLKGVLKGVKWVLKEIANFAQKHQKSQPPIFRFLDLAAKNAKDHEGKKEVIWQQ